MELRHLKYFVAVAKTLNFSEAARQLFITQGTLSQQIQQMEGEMGIRHDTAVAQNATAVFGFRHCNTLKNLPPDGIP